MSWKMRRKNRFQWEGWMCIYTKGEGVSMSVGVDEGVGESTWQKGMVKKKKKNKYRVREMKER